MAGEDGRPADGQSQTSLATAAGVAASFPVRNEVAFAVAPSGARELNTLRRPLRPSACWRIDDLRFDFDSSFILPDSAKEFRLLSAIRPTSGGEGLLMSVFGHADPTGDDDYNKTLSGRRASAVFGLLVRGVDLWEQLFSQPFRGDAWNTRHVQVMLRELGKDQVTMSGFLDEPTKAGLREFQREQGLPASGNADKATRAVLFAKYMDLICRDDDGPFKYSPSDFLSKGTSPDGKADRQGCSEFNPIFVFSKQQDQAFRAPSKKAERDAENISNRRVVVYMFSPKLAISPAAWPCPTVAEGVAGCRAQFFPDGDQRRAPQDKERQYLQRGRTFACKFYDQLARQSPCEAVRQNVRIFLVGDDGQPSRRAPYRLTTGSQVREGRSNSEGQLFEPQVMVGLTCEIEWGVTDDPGDGAILPNFARIFVNATKQDAAEGLTERQLSNLGYQRGDDDLNRQAFNFEYQLSTSTDEDIDQAHGSGKPKLRRIDES